MDDGLVDLLLGADAPLLDDGLPLPLLPVLAQQYSPSAAALSGFGVPNLQALAVGMMHTAAAPGGAAAVAALGAASAGSADGPSHSGAPVRPWRCLSSAHIADCTRRGVRATSARRERRAALLRLA